MRWQLIDKKISRRKLAIYAVKRRHERTGDQPEQQIGQALARWADLRLEHMGRKIEEHFSPHRHRMVFVDDTFYIVQSRQSLLYTRFLKRMIRKITFTYPVDINK